MLERKTDPLPKRKTFVLRLIRSAVLAFIAILLALGMGMLGYHHFESMSWIDSFVNAAMILSGMGPMGTLETFDGKLFAGLYALFSGLAFILIIGIIITPIAHRFFHKFHIEETLRDKESQTRRTYE